MNGNNGLERDSRAWKYRRLYARLWRGVDLDGVQPRQDGKRQRRNVRIARPVWE